MYGLKIIAVIQFSEINLDPPKDWVESNFIDNIEPHFIIVLGSAGIAGAFGKSEYQGELDKVADFSDAIGAIVASMTTIAITPIGIGAAVKTFRHIVLNNV